MTKPEATKHIDFVMKQNKKYIRGYIEGQQENVRDLITFINQLSRQNERLRKRIKE